MVGVVACPTLDVLLLGDGVHNYTRKISRRVAFVQNAGRNLVGVQPGPAKTLAAQPDRDNFLAVGAAAHGAITRHQRFVNRQEAAVDGKSPGRQQRIVKEVGARTVAAHNEDWAA